MKPTKQTQPALTLAAAMACSVALHADPVIYEPFDDSDSTLDGNTPGLGLDGTWSSGWTVGTGSLSYGSLSTSGNQVVISGKSNASVSPGSTLSDAGLLDDGETLWFSLLWKTGDTGGSNPDAAFALGTDPLKGSTNNNVPMTGDGIGIGVNVKSHTKLRAATWNVDMTRPDPGPTLDLDTTYLIVGEIIWGADGAASDTINLYLPDTDLAMGSVVGTTSAVLDQSVFDTISLSAKNLPGARDEIRFGATYQDVIGAGSGGFGDFPLTITSAVTGYDLEWVSQEGMLYNVWSSPDPSEALVDWDLVEGDIAASGTGTNTKNVTPPELVLFYQVEELPAPPPPPLLVENFDDAAALPAGWVSNGPSNGTDWKVGIPSGVASGPTAASSPPNCAGTNISGYYTENADVSLTSLSIAIPVGSGATLNFQQLIDTDLEGTPHDLGSVRILDADNADTPIAGLGISDIEGLGTDGWTSETLDLPVGEVGGKNIKVEFRFVSNAGTAVDGEVWGGFYVDDVIVTETTP